ncbi:MAG: PAS domain-containing protein [Dehalococcoidales bacterium]|nr:PAS domain-containing protein [Dehalococcoidales bacterium]
MKISTVLRFGTYIPVFMALVVLTTLVFSYRQMAEMHTAADNVLQIRNSINDINQIVFSYILYHEDRPKTQFAAGYEKLAGLIDDTQLNSEEQRSLLENIGRNNDAIKTQFAQLVLNYDIRDTVSSAEFQRTETALENSLMQTSYEADTDAAHLRSLVDAVIRDTQTKTTGLVAGAVILATLASTPFLAFTRRRITKSLTGLSQGASVIGSGNLDFIVEEKGDDEITQLSRAFNRMTADLKSVTASKTELEKEIEKRKQAEESLKKSEQRWATTLASIGDAVIATDKAGNTAFMNAEAELLTGWTLREASGRPVEEVFHVVNEQTRQVIESPVAKVIRTGQVCGLANHTSLVRKDGTEIPIDDSGAPIISEGGDITGAVLVFRDISRRRKVEDRVRQLADQWQLTFDSITDPISIQDKDFKLVRVNKAYADAVRMKEAELTGRKCYEVIHGLTCHIAGCPHQKTLETGKSSTVEFFEPRLGIYIEASTSPILDKNGEVTGTVHIAKNITARKKVAAALQTERAKLTGLLKSMEDGVGIISADLQLEYINPAMEAEYGPVAGRKCYEYFNNRSDVCPWCRNDEIFAGKSIRSDVQSIKTGKIYEVTYAPLKNEDGTLSKLTVWHDITERKKVEELKDGFIGMVSHELRTPLTIITGAVHTALLEGLPPDERDVLLKDAAAGAESLENILGNLLELSRYQANRLVLANEPVNIRKAVDEVVEQLKGKSPAHRLKNHVGERISVVADKVRIERILHNLIENAIKYSPDGGDVTVTASQEDGFLVIGVSDQGIGISLADQARLFLPFERLERLTGGIKGLGLGLVVCRRLVEAHGGRMWVESEEGKGSTFYFSLQLEKKD